jgi:hypothetical protein
VDRLIGSGDCAIAAKEKVADASSQMIGCKCSSIGFAIEDGKTLSISPESRIYNLFHSPISLGQIKTEAHNDCLQLRRAISIQAERKEVT